MTREDKVFITTLCALGIFCGFSMALAWGVGA